MSVADPTIAGPPVGPRVSDKEAGRPRCVTLAGRFGRVEKLEAAHAGDLWQAVNDDDNCAARSTGGWCHG